MQFKVPQFIDIEDKIFGPFSLRQFIYLAGGAGLFYLCLKLLPFPISAGVGLPIAGFALALAFYKYNEKPFINVVEAYIKYTLRSKLYIWKKEQKVVEKVDSESNQEDNNQFKRGLTESKLKTLSWSLDVIDNKK